MKTKTITGKVVWQDLEMGFWSVIADDGTEYLPVNLPTSCEKKGKSVKLEIEEQPDTMTMTMWGMPIRVMKVL